MLACIILDLFATHFSLVHDLTNADCWSDYCSTHSPVFAAFKHQFLTNRARNQQKHCCVYIFLFRFYCCYLCGVWQGQTSDWPILNLVEMPAWVWPSHSKKRVTCSDLGRRWHGCFCSTVTQCSKTINVTMVMERLTMEREWTVSNRLSPSTSSVYQSCVP